MENRVKSARAFVAVELPEDIKKRISCRARALDEAKMPVKPVRAENLHVTLKFLGDCSQEELEKVKTTLYACAGRAEPFSVAFRGVGAFPSAGKPSVLWAGADDAAGGLYSLMEEIETNLCPPVTDKKRKLFHPHVTAARVKKGIKSPERKKIRHWLEENKDADFGRMVVRRLSLFQSRLSPEGASYSLLGGFEFGKKR